MTLTVEVLNTNALNLLSNMEYLELIRLDTPTRTVTVSSEKLSNRFAGSLKFTDEHYKTFQNSLQESRNEWERNIY